MRMSDRFVGILQLVDIVSDDTAEVRTSLQTVSYPRAQRGRRYGILGTFAGGTFRFINNAGLEAKNSINPDRLGCSPQSPTSAPAGFIGNDPNVRTSAASNVAEDGWLYLQGHRRTAIERHIDFRPMRAWKLITSKTIRVG